ncbi:hypothetical protein W2_gp016 [Caulobacter phage W2]|uniref:Uncharacterized protein n=2 Tax=Kronosvirus TaxID=3425745 RepID=A0A386KPZ2_9CAUD|nr:hypothetical protein [Caulobacter phage Kronos]WDS38325.1 hypothetical protein TMCBR4_gp016 [Caulobacter phage TMCBR4]WDS38384.1 hypothetical protein W2_gp016 [Caulobacter phage W2]
MTFAFPAILGPAKIKPRLLSPFVEPESNSGDVETRFLSPGARYALDVEYPKMTAENAGLIVGALLRAATEEVTMPWPQPGLVVGTPGARALNAGASANARIIDVGGNAAAYSVRGGQFFNIVAPDGRRYLHASTQTLNVPGSLRMAPAARLELTAGWALDFTTVLIQGFIQGPETGWDVDTAKHYGVSFTIRERK